jgi:hypothetical protein
MNTILAILVVVFAIGAAVMLVRGIIVFLKTTEEDLKAQGSGPSVSGVKQNKAMQGRIIFQALAVLAAALLMLLSR